MDSTRWDRIQALFHATVDLSPDEQRRKLDTECAGDQALRDDVLNLIAEDLRGGSLLERSVAGLAHEIFQDAIPPALLAQPFGPYRIRKILGEGGMGVVYLASREDLGSHAALKILRDAWLSPARRERFAVEQRTLAHLSHPAIARLYDADTLPDGTPWFVMEYVEGAPLTAWCERHATPIPDRLRLFRAVCEAVEHAHRHLVVHRDLKPSNILVTEDGGVKLLDFGIAKQLESLDGPADQTRTGLRLMTPAYASPEQMRGAPVSIQTDVYSLGVILYELLTARLPFDLARLTPGEAEAAILEREPERPSLVVRRGGTEVARAVSRAGWADLDVLCLTAMHKDAARRYGSVQALMRDVSHFLDGQPLEARPDTLRYRVGKFVRRNRRPVAAATAGILGIMALVAFYTASLSAARNTAVSEAARSRRIQQFMQSLFQGGDQDAGPADSLRVITLVHRGVQEARNLSSEPVVQAELYETLGGILQQLGELGGADSMLLASLSRRQALFGVDHTEVARSLIALGHLRADQAQFDAAERMVRDGLTMSLRSLPADHPQVAEATTLLGRILRERGQYADAVPVLEGAVLLNARGSSPSPELGSALLELANVRYQLGQYAAADSLSQRVLAVARALYGERHPRVADALRSIGGVLYERGKYPAAEESYRKALALLLAWYGADHAETASAQTSLARALHSQGRYDEADQLLVAALAIRERILGRNHPSVAETLNELGVVAYWQDRLDDADAYYGRMLDIYLGIYGEQHQFVGVALSNLGNVALDRKDWAGAERLFRRMLDIFVEVLPPDHSNTAIGRIKLGRSMLRQGRSAAAVQESLAGYESLRTQTDPSNAFLRNARIDLMTAYDSLGQPDQMARFRSELLATGWKPPPA